MNTPQRSKSADALKTIAIFGVVFIHSSSLFYEEGDKIASIITSSFRFCVPVFIILFAYFFERSIIKQKNKIEYSDDRLKKLVIPYVFWSFLYCLILFNFQSGSFKSFVTSSWLGYGWSGQYYFIILFQLIPLHRYIRNLADIKKNKLILIFFVFYFISCYIVWDSIFVSKIGDRLFVYWIPYILFGILAAKNNYFERYKLDWKIGVISLFIVPVESVILEQFKIPHSPYVTPAVLISSLLFTHSIMSLKLTYRERPSIVEKIISIISKRTLGIFCINPLIIYLVSNEMAFFNYQNYNFFVNHIALPFSSAMLILTLAVSLIYVIDRVGLKPLVKS